MSLRRWPRISRQPSAPCFPTTPPSISGNYKPNSVHLDEISGGRFIPSHPILPLLESIKNPDDIKKLHAYTVTSGLIKDNFTASRVIGLCLNSFSGDPNYVQMIFDRIDRPDVYTWNAMIRAHAERNSPEIAISFCFQMLRQSIPANNYTFALLVKACNLGSDVYQGKKVHGLILKNGVEDLLVIRNSLMNMYCNLGNMGDARQLFDKSPQLDLISWNSMISWYGKFGDVQSAQELFERMPERSLVSWTAMIDGYVRSGLSLEGLRLFNQMQILGLKVDVVTLVSVLKACANLGALDQGKWVHIYINKNKLGKGNVVLGTALVDMYAKCGCIDMALEVFNGMHQKDIVLWNAMIGGLAMHGYGRDALELFWSMRRLRVMPNGTTLIGVLCACTHAGMVGEGIEIFDSMAKDFGIKPEREHYGCMADLLGRAGLLREAEELISNMPMEPQALQWGALMAACRTHGNVEVGERVGRHLISLEPEDGGRYVLLANIYAGAGRWEDALEMRRVMEEKGIKKEPGLSFIEWDGVVHEFLVGDKRHPQHREIYAILGEMETKLKKAGYSKDTRQVLVDMDDEEEKEIALSYHSEKLAMAFGILNIGKEMPIRIVKNLRVCRDCHSHAKLISKVYDREIIVRDRNRFHRFREGLCSCMDYW